MLINQNAPVVADGELTIAAAPELVWDVMVAIERWPEWNPDIKWATLDGELAVGSQFRWKSGPGTITSTLQGVERPRFLAWTGQTLGIKAVHVWRLDATGDSTVVRTEESWEGLMVRLFRGSMKRTLKKAIDAGLGYLKIEAERRSAEALG